MGIVTQKDIWDNIEKKFSPRCIEIIPTKTGKHIHIMIIADLRKSLILGMISGNFAMIRSPIILNDKYTGER